MMRRTVGLPALLCALSGILAFAAGILPAKAQESAPPRRTVVLISMDGMRGDYMNPTDMPFTAKLRQDGVSSEHLLPVFPSLTFPSHLSIATGVCVEKHGIVSNRFLDPASGKIEDYPSDTGLIGAKPIWVLTEEAGVRTALDQWPVAYGAWQGKRPTIQSEKFEGDRTDPESVERLLALLRKPAEERPRFVMMYFRGADKVGHQDGPDSPELKAKLKEIDGVLEGMITQLRALPVAPELAVVLVTDHGMCEVKKMINLQALWEREGLPGRYVTSGPIANVFAPDKADQDRILAALKTVPELAAWRAAELPEAFRYRHARAGDIVVVAHEGNMFKERARSPEVVYQAKSPRGMHGYPPELPSMHGMFLAFGAGLRKGVVLERASVLDVHPTICALLGIPPGEVDGRVLQEALEEVEKN